jgi:hypothetical protein
MVDSPDDQERSDRVSAADLSSVRDRTGLAWTRSGLAVAVTAAVIVRRLWPLSPDRAVAVLAVVAAVAVCWLVAAHLARVRLSAIAGGGLSVSTGRVLTYVTLVLAAIGVIITFVCPGRVAGTGRRARTGRIGGE